MRLTPTLKIEIVEAARNTKDCSVESTIGLSYSLLEEWIQRGARQKKRQKSGIHRELVEELKPFLREMYKRELPKALMRPSEFFNQLASMAEKDERVEQIVTVWFNAMWLTNPKVPESRRLEMARQIGKIFRRPVHPGRWHFVTDELDWRAEMNDGSRESETTDAELPAVFLAARLKKRKEADDFDEIYGDYREMWRLIDDIMTDDLSRTEWRKSETRRVRSSSHSKKEERAITAQPRQKTKIQGDPSVEEQFRQVAERKKNDELRQFVRQRLEHLTKISPDRLKRIIQRQKISTINALADKLGVERTKLHRAVILPAREFKVKNS